MQRWDIDGRKVKPDAVIGFVLGLIVAVGAARILGPSQILTTLVITAVAGAWYHYRKVL